MARGSRIHGMLLSNIRAQNKDQNTALQRGTHTFILEFLSCAQTKWSSEQIHCSISVEYIFIVVTACLEIDYCNPPSPPQVHIARLQCHLWTNETLGTETVLGGMCHIFALCCVFITCINLQKSFCICRSAWNILFTWCSTGRSKRRSGISLLPKAGGTGKSLQLNIRRLNWSRPIRVFWTISSGSTKSPNTPI